jgi:hypothetical protein
LKQGACTYDSICSLSNLAPLLYHFEYSHQVPNQAIGACMYFPHPFVSHKRPGLPGSNFPN